MGTLLTLGDIDTAEKLATWFATADSTGRGHEALALLQQEYGADVAEEIWVRGSQMADGLGVWANKPKTTPGSPWLQNGRWRQCCPDCPHVAQNPDRIGVREDLERHRATDCPARTEVA